MQSKNPNLPLISGKGFSLGVAGREMRVLPPIWQKQEYRMVHTVCLYLAIVALSIGTVAAYVLPLP
jgi:hypothetical protein